MTTDPGSGDADIRFLVPVSDSPTLDATVEYAAREAREVAAETDDRVAFVLLVPSPRDGPPGDPERERESLLAEAEATAADILEMTDPEGTVDLERATLELERYPVDSVEYADAIVEFVAGERHTVVVDPDHRTAGGSPIGHTFESVLREADSIDLEVAPVERLARQRRFATRGGLAQFLTLAGLSFGFYMLVGGFSQPVFDLVTGTATALVVAGALSRITFERAPAPVGMVRATARWLAYVPYLLWQILTANVRIAYVVLHPDLPIDPSVQRFEAGVWGGTATATLANSITLTPGTLTLDVRNREFVVHSLTEDARADLLDGGLERAVRFVFYGREAMRYPSPRERLAAGDADDDRTGEAA
ncbi:monovalent cation/H+ antiporter subunit E [Saliphagus sp. LR7]|uniref:monovalent cation/H+ antiporter subunit E n=1 Tax=Saliphagus sp. LR7 TaxID=2282654 RepID=UPI000DF81806|nr:monovalent cation/H+ antiporter subunit E [Saliphagus sp. LR7]